jgi:hypothetical protein
MKEYLDLIRTNSEPVFTLINNEILPSSFSAQFIEAILLAETEKLEPFKESIYMGQPEYKSAIYELEDLAFSLLLQQPQKWINKYSDTIEKIFVNALKQKNDNVLIKIKSLVVQTKAGIKPDFIERIIHKMPDIVDKKEEIDLWIMWCNVIDNIIDHKSKIHKIGVIKATNKPWLGVLHIYLEKDNNPRLALNQLSEWEESNYMPSEKEKEYLTVYLRHALYKLLSDTFNKEAYEWYYDFHERYILQKRFSTRINDIEENNIVDDSTDCAQFFYKLREDILKTEFMDEISKEYAQYKENKAIENHRALDKKVEIVSIN